MSKRGQVKTEVDSPAAEPNAKGKKGKKKKNTEEESTTKTDNGEMKQELITDHLPVVKKKRKIDRFNGMPEEEVLLKMLPDRLAYNLDILIIGINPGLFAAYIGHHYAGPGNHFWKCLYLSGLVPEPMNCYDDIKLQQFGIGFTNICARTSRGSADLKRKEIEEGGQILKEKLKEYKPKIAVFNGKGIYEVFSGSKKFIFGKQPGFVEGTNTIAYVMPSSSARCSQLPRAIDKVPFYEALRRLRDYMVGRIPHLDESQVTFPTLELKTAVKKEQPTENGATTGEDVSNKGKKNSGGGGKGDVTSQSGSDPLPTIKKEPTASSRGRGKGKKRGDTQEQMNDDAPAVGETNPDGEEYAVRTHVQDQLTTDTTSSSRENQLILNEANQTNPQVSSKPSYQFQHPLTNPLLQMSGLVPGINGLPLNPFSTIDFTSLRPAGLSASTPQGFSTTASQDYMSGFYAGSHPFGMVGFPSAVAPQQQDKAIAGAQSGKEPVKIKTEPVDEESQH